MLARTSRSLLFLGSCSTVLAGSVLAGTPTLAPVELESTATNAQLETPMEYPAERLMEVRGVKQSHRYDWETRSLVAPSAADAQSLPLTTIFSNTCTLGYFVSLDPCNILYDQGTIPSTTNPSAGVGAVDSNVITGFTFEYCTSRPTDDVSIEILFWESADLSSFPTPDPLTAKASFLFTGLPGDTGSGNCHEITVINLGLSSFCMLSDGDGVYDGVINQDEFAWAFISHTGDNDTGPLIAGDPFTGAFGDCTYSNPCGGCATGLGAQDGFAVGILGVPCGSSPLIEGTYNYGGYMYGNPFAGFRMELESPGACLPCGTAPESYCTAGISAAGCMATLSATGTPSASAASGFTLTASNVPGMKDGLFFQGVNGRQAVSWGNGTSFQCVVPPARRLGLLPGNGTVGVCDGTKSQDLNARWTVKPAKNPGAGAVVQVQLWYRDPFSTSNQATAFSDAMEFTVCP